ncbi:hypothetical protein [Streptomyces sp. TLI_171]|uniref:hypothetical protein n=1 Tax=Streptomyces sp. TLI_171 TaxID=1938859 RepID=UPI000C173F86|nr:hypothetical protein [Streptomyces sp. TLI_171]RKE23269.1 hypothetical protein BX266_6731 [Streptomyces sp. TLI_171]
MGYLFGPLMFVVPLALGGLIVQLTTRRGRIRVAEDTAGVQHAVWERRHRVWQEAHLCRQCRVAFFPKGSLGPDFPGSPAMEVAQLPGWVTTTAASLTLDAPSPTAPR